MIEFNSFHQFYNSFISGSIRRFSGDKSNANFFKILGNDEKSLLIGARNVVYNVSLPSLEENIDQVRYFFDSTLLIIHDWIFKLFVLAKNTLMLLK